MQGQEEQGRQRCLARQQSGGIQGRQGCMLECAFAPWLPVAHCEGCRPMCHQRALCWNAAVTRTTVHCRDVVGGTGVAASSGCFHHRRTVVGNVLLRAHYPLLLLVHAMQGLTCGLATSVAMFSAAITLSLTFGMLTSGAFPGEDYYTAMSPVELVDHCSCHWSLCSQHMTCCPNGQPPSHCCHDGVTCPCRMYGV